MRIRSGNIQASRPDGSVLRGPKKVQTPVRKEKEVLGDDLDWYSRIRIPLKVVKRPEGF